MRLIDKDRPASISKYPVHRYMGTAILSVVMSLMLLAWLPLAAWAHAPKEVVLSYDQAKKILSVRISHLVKNPAGHYISKVEIKKNGQAIPAAEYGTQPQQDPFVYDYPMEVSPGDVVEVKATCSIFGSKTVKLDLPKTR
jgi:hypothetical protein